jgi:hypothetical protein
MEEPTTGSGERDGSETAGHEKGAGGSSKQMESGYYSVVSKVTTDGRVMVGNDIEIFPSKPRDDLSSTGTRAFEAKDRRLTGEQFALLCSRGAVPRVTLIGSYKNLKSPHIMKLVDAGIVNWLPEDRQRFALIYERPFGKKVLAAPDAKPFKMSEDRIISTIIQPIVSVLADLRNVDIVHGAVNPENIFLIGGEGSETVILGECLSSAPSYRQHPLFETIERSMAQASGRGPGTSREDLYALGMSVAMMVRGENFMLGKSHRQIIHDKIEHGSYGSIIGRERLPGGISEFLRGVLNDDEGQRWDIDDVFRWLDGRRLSPKQQQIHLKAARPFIFCEEKYWDLRALAQAFSENVVEAANAVDKDNFDLWLKRNFEDKALTARLAETWKKEKGSPRDKLLSAVCMAIDVRGPVRYKGLSIFPAGFGGALAEAMEKGEDIQIYAEMIVQQLFGNWISQQFEDIPDATGLMGIFEKCRSALTQKMSGYGIERVLYILSKEAVCMSPLLKDFFVAGPGGLLMALEKISRQANRPAAMLDRHMIAFISVREPKMIDPHLGHVISQDKSAQIIGAARTFAAIQRRFSTGPMVGVGNWLISTMAPVIEHFNDRDLRQEMASRLSKLQDQGNLGAILELVDDNRLVQDDTQRFNAAKYEYQRLLQEKKEIEGYLKKRKYFGRSTGRQVAMFMSSILSVFIILGYVILHFIRGL